MLHDPNERTPTYEKQPELTAITKQTLIDTYFSIIAEGKKATVDAVTKRAGYNRCTFYRYFTDTEQLLTQVETKICDAFGDSFTQQALTASPAEIIGSLASVYQQYGEYLSVLLGKHGDHRFVVKMKAMIHPIAHQLFTAAADSNIFADLKEEFVLSAVLATVTKWYEMKQPISVTELSVLIRGILEHGIFNSGNLG